MDKKELGFLAALIGLGFLIRGYFLRLAQVVIPDEAYYIQAGLNLIQKGTYEAFGESQRGQPLLPFIFGWISQFSKDPIAACRWISIIVGVLTVIPFHLAVRSFSSESEAFWSDLIYLFIPFSIQYSILAMTHSFFNFFLVLLFLFVLRARKSENPLWMILAGLTGWAAYMTRVEAIPFIALLVFNGLVFQWLQPKSSKASFVFIFLVTFIVCSIPFWVWIKAKTGFWQLTWIEQGVGAKQFFWNHFPRGSAGFFYLKNLFKIYFSVFPLTLPLFIWICIAFGVLQVFFRDKEKMRQILLMIPFACFPILFYPLWSTEGRFFTPSLIFFLMFFGVGIQFLCSRTFGFYKTLLSGLLLLILLFHFGFGYQGLAYVLKEEPLEQKRIGVWIRDHYLSPQIIFASDRRVCFYAGQVCGKLIRMSNKGGKAPLDKKKFEQFISQEGINLVVADSRFIKKYYPSYQYLLEPSNSGHLEKVIELKEQEEDIILYQFR